MSLLKTTLSILPPSCGRQDKEETIMRWRSQYDDMYVENDAAGRFNHEVTDHELQELIARHIQKQDNE